MRTRSARSRQPLGVVPMRRAVGGSLAAALALIGLLSAAPALAADPRIPLTADPVTLPAGEYCQGFTALITFPDFNQYIISQTTDPTTGATILHITGRARATVTRLDTTGNPVKSVSFNISGPGTLVLNTDGSFSGDVHGPNLLWTARANLADFPEVPTISYTTGHVTFAVDDSGQTTSYSLAGRRTDVCAVLS
jgi:hypothetical protein